MKRKYIVGLAAGVLLIAATAALAKAEYGRHAWGFGPGHFLGRMARQLDLTDAQKTEIKSLVQAERPHYQPLLKQLADGREQMLALTKGGNFDEAKVRALARQQAQTLTELIVVKERVQAKIYNVLTPEQRAKVEQMQQRHSERIQKFLNAPPAQGTAPQDGNPPPGQ